VVEAELVELGVVQGAGDEVAYGRDGEGFALLGFSVRRIERNAQKHRMRTASSQSKVLFSRSASATAAMPTVPMLLWS
jgi:hypothetical protein